VTSLAPEHVSLGADYCESPIEMLIPVLDWIDPEGRAWHQGTCPRAVYLRAGGLGGLEPSRQNLLPDSRNAACVRTRSTLITGESYLRMLDRRASLGPSQAGRRTGQTSGCQSPSLFRLPCDPIACSDDEPLARRGVDRDEFCAHAVKVDDDPHAAKVFTGCGVVIAALGRLTSGFHHLVECGSRGADIAVHGEQRVFRRESRHG